MNLSIVLRSGLFAAIQILLTLIFTLIALLTFPFAPLTRYRVITLWSRLVILAARWICGISYQVVGAQHIPAQSCVVLAKHQSAWETLAFQSIFPPQVYLIKRELLRIPFFGWGLAMLSPIAIERGAGTRALKQLLREGGDRLARGFWIIVFPEGSRMAPGERGRYQNGGAALAIRAAVPVLPVAHNAGSCWPRHAFIKHPGTITVSIGAPIDTHGMTAAEVTAGVENWIESEMQRLPDPGAPA